MELIKVGQKINIIINIERNNHVEITCKIIDKKYDRLELELPQYFMRYIQYFEIGAVFTSKIFTKLGTIDFNSTMLTVPTEGVFIIEFDKNAYRLAPNVEIPSVSCVEELYIYRNDEKIKCKTFEISTNYLKFSSFNNFKVGEIFDCELVLPKDYGVIKINAILDEVDLIYDNEFKIIYSRISEADRDKLLYYLYLYSMNVD